MNYQVTNLKNGLTIIKINLKHLESVTSLIAVGAGSRNETKSTNGISHFLEHMFFKGSKTYPSAQQISTLIDGIGAVNNASTSKEYTYYWIKSASKNIQLSLNILSSMISQSLLKEDEIEREKGVIIEELRMIRDNPSHYIWDLYEKLQFGDQPLGWDIGGEEEIIKKFTRNDFINYIDSLYSPKNMVLVLVGNLPENIDDIIQKNFDDLPSRSFSAFTPYQKIPQQDLKINIHHKQTDQANIILGVESFSRSDPKRYPARLLGLILGGGMSSRLFIQIRERRGLAYHVSSGNEIYKDTGAFVCYSGLKLEKVEEGLKVIKDELDKITSTKVAEEELKKAKEMERGRLALWGESTNYLAEYFGIKYVLDSKIETFEQYLEKIDSVTTEDIQNIAKELFLTNRYNLQVIGPIKNISKFEKILKS